jgi:hypothetical protein
MPVQTRAPLKRPFIIPDRLGETAIIGRLFRKVGKRSSQAGNRNSELLHMDSHSVKHNLAVLVEQDG